MLAHIDTENRKFDARRNRTHNLAVYSRTRYQCATTSKLTFKETFGSCVCVGRRDAFCQDLGLEHIELEASNLL